MVYSDCGLFGFNKTLFDKNLLCGKDTTLNEGKCVADVSMCGRDTKFEDGKCVAHVDIKSDNAYVCGENTNFVGGKCVADIDITSDNVSVCGNDTKFVGGKCVADSSVCGNDTKFVDGKCIAAPQMAVKAAPQMAVKAANPCGRGTRLVRGKCEINYVDDRSLIQHHVMRPNDSTGYAWDLPIYVRDKNAVPVKFNFTHTCKR